MRRNPRMFRLSATVAIVALLSEGLAPLAAVAQPAPPPLAQPGQGRPELNQEDPPTRVGRIAQLTGTVSFHNQGDTSWSPASLNYPLSNGNSFWTGPNAQAQLQISDSRIVMGGETELDVVALDASGFQAITPQGEVYVHLRDLAPHEAWSVQTPRGLVRLGGAGRYEVVVGTTEQPTLVTVIDGSAQIEGPGVSLSLAGGQTATVVGADSFQGSIGPALRDPFLTATLDAERPPPAPPVAIPTQVVAMAGGSDLSETGSWSDAPQYGRVWYPPVSPQWVPYREGHWAYVAPWGWTWIDNASWGFTPFHYGRWIEIGGRWAWTPGEVAVASPPVYAPALVSFIGIGAGVALGAALASGSIGWVPLGPREPFRPWYHASPNYVREVNVSHVSNINVSHVTNINNVTVNNYVNRGAATAIPAAAMTGSRPVQAVARPVTAQEFAAARPIVGRQPIRPIATTAGITPVVARQLQLPTARAVQAAPGPVVHPRAAGERGFVRPAFAPAGVSNPAVAPPAHPGVTPPGAVPPGPRPGAVATPEPGRPGVAPQAAARPGQPGAARAQPAQVAPHPPQAEPHPGGRPAPQATARPAPQPALRPAGSQSAARPGPEATVTPPQQSHRTAAAAMHEPQRPVPPAVVHPEPQRPVPPVAMHPEPQRPAPPAPRPEPQRIAVPAAPRPEARPAPHPQPQEHRKAPGEP